MSQDIVTELQARLRALDSAKQKLQPDDPMLPDKLRGLNHYEAAIKEELLEISRKGEPI